MSRYWSLDECCWVEYSSATSAASVPVQASGVEPEVVDAEQVPERAAAAPQRAPSVV